MEIFLFSNGTGNDGKLLGYGIGHLEEAIIRTGAKRFLFIPYAIIRGRYEEREEQLNAMFEGFGASVKSIHHFDNPSEVLSEYDGYLVSGGNTWVLNRTLHDNNLTTALNREVTINNKMYIGWSAGSNVACPTIRTTNDMPIISAVITPSIGLVPFQLNPHYLDASIEGHHGETREERIMEYLRMNEREIVVGLREGNFLHVSGSYEAPKMQLISENGNTMRIFKSEDEIYELGVDDDLSFLFSIKKG